MQELEVSIKAKNALRNMFNIIDEFFGFKMLYGDFETKQFKGRDCGEALNPDPVSDNRSWTSGHYTEPVITSAPTNVTL